MGVPVQPCSTCFLNCLLNHKKDSSRSHSVASFFKVMYGKRFSEELIVPPKFTKTISSFVDKKTYLEDSSGRKCNVVLSRVNGTLVFRKGWYKFCTDHGIELGDFVVFHYIKGSHFAVQIYGTSGCEKLTVSKENGYSNKRLKTTRDWVAGNEPFDSSYEEPIEQDNSTSCAFSEPHDIFQKKAEVNTTENPQFVAQSGPIHENISQKPEVIPTTDFRPDPCLMVDRNTSSGNGDDKRYLYDLSSFEIPAKEVVAYKNCEPEFQENIDSQASSMLQEVVPETASIDFKMCSITEGDTPSKNEEAFLMKRECVLPSLSCPRDDMLLDSNNPQKPIGMPHNSDLATPGERMKIVKQEPMDFGQDFGGIAEADASVGVSWHLTNISSANVDGGQFCENVKPMVKKVGNPDIVLKSEPVDLCDSSALSLIKTTCLVQQGNESFLELPEHLPAKMGKRMLSKKLVFLQDPARRLWPVVYHLRQNIKVLVSGWDAFRKANNIKPEDKCTFLVKNLEESIFTVQISHS